MKHGAKRIHKAYSPQKRALPLSNRAGCAPLGCWTDPRLPRPPVPVRQSIGAGARASRLLPCSSSSCSSSSCSSSSPLLVLAGCNALPKMTALQLFPELDFFAVKLKTPEAQLYLASLGGEVGGRSPRFMRLLNAPQFEAKQSNQVGLCQFAQNLLAL